MTPDRILSHTYALTRASVEKFCVANSTVKQSSVTMNLEEGGDTSGAVTVLVCFGQRNRAVTFKRMSSVSDVQGRTDS